MTDPLVKISEVSKSFLRRKRSVHALNGVNLDVQAGEIVTLLGHNGAGKSTLLKVMATLVTPDAGTVTIGEASLQQANRLRRRIGWLTPEERSFYWRLTGRQNLDFFSGLLNLSRAQSQQRIEALSDQLELKAFIDRRFDQYSAGMRQKLALARALLHEPTVLLLDEPTRSIDLESKERLRDTLKELVRDRVHTVILVTHEHAYARSISDRLVIMRNGRIDRIEKRTHHGKPGTTHHQVTVTILSEAEYDRLLKLPAVTSITHQTDRQQSLILTPDLDGMLPSLVQHGSHIVDIRPTKEDSP